MLKAVLCLSVFTVPIFSAEYSAQMAQNHIGEKATVCGEVVSTHYASSSNGEPTFLNPYPN